MEITKKQKVILSLLLGGVAAIGPFSIDMYIPGFPSISKEFDVPDNIISYTLTSFFVGISLGQLIYGPIIDRYGRTKPLMIGFSLYLLTSIGCTFAPDITSLIFLRFFQALGSSVGMVAGSAIIRDTFNDNREVAKMLSSILLVMGVAPIIAPTVGSFVVDQFGWRSIFILLSIFVTILIINIKLFLKETHGSHPENELKIRNIAKNYWNTLKIPTFTKFSLAGSISMSIMFGYISSISFILMNLYGVPKHIFGILFGINAGGFIIGSQINRALLKKYKLHKLTKIMMRLQVIVAILFLVLAYTIDVPLWLFCLLMFSILFLLGFINPNTTAISLEPLKTNLGIASALNGAMRMAFGAMSSYLVGALYNQTILPLVWMIAILTTISLILVFEKRRNRTI